MLWKETEYKVKKNNILDRLGFVGKLEYDMDNNRTW
jgi:hypothetical protein